MIVLCVDAPCITFWKTFVVLSKGQKLTFMVFRMSLMVMAWCWGSLPTRWKDATSSKSGNHAKEPWS